MNVRVVCGHCGYNKILEKLSTRSKHLVIGAPVGPYFHLPLWLKMEMGDPYCLKIRPATVKFIFGVTA